MEIARAAAGLFVSRGLKATRAEDIAQAAGIAPRTFYRYFATKEEAVAPLYSAGAERWAEALREAPAELQVPQALEHAVRHTLVTGRGVSAASWEWVRTLIRLAVASPALGKVWAEVCHTSETTIAEVLAERAAATEARTSSPQASPSTAAEPPDASHGVHTSDGAAAAAAAADAEAGAPPEGRDLSGAGAGVLASEAPDATEAPPASPRQRFTAAVASAAVRVAVESWAVTDAAPTGPQGPAELALHNLRALHGFAWEAGPAKRT
ncbi:TetR family transcriptional regulator [Streptomyces sp. NBC_00199]|uniref:TetR family transcriptional regulator n=1 Tax=Streptomyces sp. NBC_00199 TaxID=2975678 RepID=UPI0022516B77|nr:TetR family transcriptional regulator [Streptomyces sp. NBC_00199]MCX5265320.1 TetR/AcrR family transcriptional regulator [Streptomyces sp. NBC_00199]